MSRGEEVSCAANYLRQGRVVVFVKANKQPERANRLALRLMELERNVPRTWLQGCWQDASGQVHLRWRERTLSAQTIKHVAECMLQFCEHLTIKLKTFGHGEKVRSALLGVHTYQSLERKFILIERELGQIHAQLNNAGLENFHQEQPRVLCNASCTFHRPAHKMGTAHASVQETCDVSRTAELLLFLSQNSLQ